MLVIVSWVSFWLDQGAVPARVSLGNCNLYVKFHLIVSMGLNGSLAIMCRACCQPLNCLNIWDFFLAFPFASIFYILFIFHRCHHTANNGHTNIRYQCITTARFLYQGHRCMDGRMSNVCVWRAA